MTLPVGIEVQLFQVLEPTENRLWQQTNVVLIEPKRLHLMQAIEDVTLNSAKSSGCHIQKPTLIVYLIRGQVLSAISKNTFGFSPHRKMHLQK